MNESSKNLVPINPRTKNAAIDYAFLLGPAAWLYTDEWKKGMVGTFIAVYLYVAMYTGVVLGNPSEISWIIVFTCINWCLPIVVANLRSEEWYKKLPTTREEFFFRHFILDAFGLFGLFFMLLLGYAYFNQDVIIHDHLHKQLSTLRHSLNSTLAIPSTESTSNIKPHNEAQAPSVSVTEQDPKRALQIANERKQLVELIIELQEKIAIDKAQVGVDPSDYITAASLAQNELLLLKAQKRLQVLRQAARK